MATMTKEARAARNAYVRKWRHEHPEKVQEYEARRWQKVADKIAQEKAQGKACSESGVI